MKTPKERKEMKANGRDNQPHHFDAGKPRVDVIPAEVLMSVGEVFGYGAAKYGEWNWAEHADAWGYTQLLGSGLRHIFAWSYREDVDPESGLPHLDHAIANLMMLRQLILAGRGVDDRNPMYLSEYERFDKLFPEELDEAEEELDKENNRDYSELYGRTHRILGVPGYYTISEVIRHNMGWTVGDNYELYPPGVEGGNDREDDVEGEKPRVFLPRER